MLFVKVGTFGIVLVCDLVQANWPYMLLQQICGICLQGNF